jgi:WD40 repeat protein
VRCVLVRCLLEGHTDAVLCIAADADGYIYTGSDDETIRVWDTNDSWRCVQVGSDCAWLCCSILAAGRPIGVQVTECRRTAELTVAIQSPVRVR